MNCPQCGVEIKPEQVLCVKCGYKIREVSKKKGLHIGCIIGIVVGFFLFVFFGGCVAAIAIPQYARAVEMSRATEAYTITKALAQSEERYNLTTNKYTADFSKLDIEIPDSKVEGNKAETELYTYEINLPNIKVIRKENPNFEYTFNYNMQTKKIQCQGAEIICGHLSN